MKKTFLLIAILSVFATAAHAQNSLKIAGRLDVGYGVSNGGNFAGKGGVDGKFQQWSSGKSPSYWSLRGSEDLSNGNKVFFQLESALNLENGTSNGFSRDAYVGISGNFGQFRAGRQKSALNYAMGKYDLAGRPNLTSAVNMAGVSAQTPRLNTSTLGRYDSALVYMSPKMQGFQLTAAMVLKNDDIRNKKDDAKTIYELVGEYSYKDFSIAGAYRSKLYEGVNSAWGISARYDFKVFMLSAGFFNNNIQTDGKGYFVGVRAPFGAWRVGAQVAYNTDAVTGAKKDNEVKPLAWELFAYYTLSKRTQLYFIYGGLNNDAKTFQNAQRNYSAAAGIVHTF